MSKKAQALLELALFSGLLLMILLTALNYQRTFREQRLTDEDVFAKTKDQAFKTKFIEKDIDGQSWICTGGIISYSLNMDQQANRLFQGGQRRTAVSSSSVYWSGAEDPPLYEYNYYNNTSLPMPEKKIYTVRPGGSEDPEDGMKLTALDYIAALYPMAFAGLSWVSGLEKTTWWSSWGSYIDFALRAAAFAYLASRYNDAVSKLEDSENERAALKGRDEFMSENGWRVCDKVHDGDALAGANYVKKLTPQVFDIVTEETKTVDYDETQKVAPTYTSTRNVNVGHQVKRTFSRRYDITVPDPATPFPPLSTHLFEPVSQEEITIDLSGVQNETWN